MEALKDIVAGWSDRFEWEEMSDGWNLRVPADELLATAKRLKEDPATSLDYLYCLSGVDWPDCLEVVYHLESTQLGHGLVLRAKTDGRENPVLDTVCFLWATAEFHEREAYELYGIHFAGHPDLRRLLLPDEWDGYPLRKDYKDEINIVEL